MKRKYYWIILAIIIMIAVSSPYLYLQYINYKIANINSKYCEQTSDCILEPGSCCSPEVLVNKEYEELQKTKNDIENLFSNEQIAQCSCPTAVLSIAIRNEASCYNNECVKKPYLDCDYLCEEYNNTRRLIEYADNNTNYTIKMYNLTMNDTEYYYLRQRDRDVYGVNNMLELINETLNSTAKILNRTTDDINSTCNC